MPKRKRESKTAFRLSGEVLAAAWQGGDAWRALFGRRWPEAWEKLAPMLAARNPLPWYNTFWDVTDDLPAGLRTPPWDRWAETVAGQNVYDALWRRRCRWLSDHPDTLGPVDWLRFRTGSKARFVEEAENA